MVESLSQPSRHTLHDIAERHGLALMYLFGSQVDAGVALLQGKTVQLDDPLSDIDVGVVFKDGLPEPSQGHAFTRISTTN